ncbi:MAG: phospholipase D-like domain-containing protein [Halobacteriales archaeon]
MFDGPSTPTAAVARLLVAFAAVTAAAAPVAAGVAGAATGDGGCGPTPDPATPTTGTADPARAGEGRSDAFAIRSVYPNPVRDGDRGEFVVLELPAPGNWTLADDETRVRLTANVSGRVVLSATSSAVPRSVAGQTVELPEMPALSNAGETLRLARNGTVVDRVNYEDAPEGERYRPAEGFEPMGATDFAVNGTGSADATAFVLPDAPGVAREVLRSTDRRILLAGYTLTSERVVSALAAAAGCGVRVRVLLEGGPVGGISRRQARLLDRLSRAGVEVQVVAGPRARYVYHHAKYAVVDDRAVVLSENWKPAGTGGGSSRGWGAVVDGRWVLVGSLNWNRHASRENREVALVLSGQTVAGYYTDVFRADWRSGNRRAPVGLLLVAVLAGVLAARWAIDRIEFAEPADPVDVSLRGPRTATGSPDPRRVRPPPSSRRGHRALPRGAPRRT